MRRLVFFAIVSFTLPVSALARTTYDTSHLPYSDAPQDLPTGIAVSVLTDEGILQGNPDGTFRPSAYLNRAEYVKIVMGLVDTEDMAFTLGCFPDVPAGAWYEVPVCKARAYGIVRGNAVDGVPPSQWLFVPERSVQYEEAVKVLVELFGLPVPTTDGEWYEPYLEVAATHGIDIGRLRPGQRLTRGEMARLVVGFVAYDRAELDDLRAAERGEAPPASSSASSASSESSRPATTPTPPSSASYDPDTDDSTRGRIIVLGKSSPVMAAASVFLEQEPFNVTDIVVKLTAASSSIDFFRVYDQDGLLLGTAYLDPSSSGQKEYWLQLQTGQLSIPKAESTSFYVRPVTKDKDHGGVSGETAQVATLTVEGDGDWSNRFYTKSSSETFSIFQTARSGFISIANAGAANEPLSAGSDQLLGTFRFAGEKGDSSAKLEIQTLTFQIERSSGLTLGSVELATEYSSERMACTVGATTVTCSSLTTAFGAVNDGTRTLRLFGDITVPQGAASAFLRLTLNEPGTTSSAGAVQWTDGTSTLQWVPFETPVARGTYFSL